VLRLEQVHRGSVELAAGFSSVRHCLLRDLLDSRVNESVLEEACGVLLALRMKIRVVVSGFGQRFEEDAPRGKRAIFGPYNCMVCSVSMVCMVCMVSMVRIVSMVSMVHSEYGVWCMAYGVWYIYSECI
jgi:hypothetical protein